MNFECQLQVGRTRDCQVPSVVIADDDPGCMGSIERALGSLSVPTIRCRDGADAWAALEGNPRVSVAILNWMLPRLDGYQIARQLREQGREVTIVLMVGRVFLQEAWGQYRVYAQHFLAKPLDPAETAALIQRVVSNAVQTPTGGKLTCVHRAIHRKSDRPRCPGMKYSHE